MKYNQGHNNQVQVIGPHIVFELSNGTYRYFKCDPSWKDAEHVTLLDNGTTLSDGFFVNCKASDNTLANPENVSEDIRSQRVVAVNGKQLPSHFNLGHINNGERRMMGLDELPEMQNNGWYLCVEGFEDGWPRYIPCDESWRDARDVTLKVQGMTWYNAYTKRVQKGTLFPGDGCIHNDAVITSINGRPVPDFQASKGLPDEFRNSVGLPTLPKQNKPQGEMNQINEGSDDSLDAIIEYVKKQPPLYGLMWLQSYCTVSMQILPIFDKLETDVAFTSSFGTCSRAYFYYLKYLAFNRDHYIDGAMKALLNCMLVLDDVTEEEVQRCYTDGKIQQPSEGTELIDVLADYFRKESSNKRKKSLDMVKMWDTIQGNDVSQRAMAVLSLSTDDMRMDEFIQSEMQCYGVQSSDEKLTNEQKNKIRHRALDIIKNYSSNGDFNDYLSEIFCLLTMTKNNEIVEGNNEEEEVNKEEQEEGDEKQDKLLSKSVKSVDKKYGLFSSNQKLLDSTTQKRKVPYITGGKSLYNKILEKTKLNNDNKQELANENFPDEYYCLLAELCNRYEQYLEALGRQIKRSPQHFVEDLDNKLAENNKQRLDALYRSNPKYAKQAAINQKRESDLSAIEKDLLSTLSNSNLQNVFDASDPNISKQLIGFVVNLLYNSRKFSEHLWRRSDTERFFENIFKSPDGSSKLVEHIQRTCKMDSKDSNKFSVDVREMAKFLLEQADIARLRAEKSRLLMKQEQLKLGNEKLEQDIDQLKLLKEKYEKLISLLLKIRNMLLNSPKKIQNRVTHNQTRKQRRRL